MSEEYKDYYDKIAPIFDHVRLDRNTEIETTTTIIRQYIKPDEGNILDIGCGTGRYSLPLRELGYNVVGIDKSINQLRYAPETFPLICASATAIPLKVGLSAACLVILVIHQLTLAERTQCIEESHRVLKPKGKLFIKTCSHDDLRRRPFNPFFPSSLTVNLNRYPDIDKLNDDLRKSGFNIIEVHPTFTEEFLDKGELLSSVRNKHNTTLTLIPKEEFETGCIEMERAFVDQDKICVPHYHTIIVVEK
ncbi:MAG TPA: class I SAM-dependent methyltransferase [Pyrinomonadaceae bacterium]|jgi:SAM-dependent methyltransferase